MMSIIETLVANSIENTFEDKMKSIVSNVKNELTPTSLTTTILMVFDKDFVYKNIEKEWYKCLKTKCKNTISNYKTQTINFIIATDNSKCKKKHVEKIRHHLKKYLDNVGSVKHVQHEGFDDVCSKIQNSVFSFNYCVLSSNFMVKYQTLYGVTLLQPTVNGVSPLNSNGLSNANYTRPVGSMTLLSKLNNLTENKIIIQSLFPNNNVVSTCMNAFSLLDTFHKIHNECSNDLITYDPNLSSYLTIYNTFLMGI